MISVWHVVFLSTVETTWNISNPKKALSQIHIHVHVLLHLLTCQFYNNRAQANSFETQSVLPLLIYIMWRYLITIINSNFLNIFRRICLNFVDFSLYGILPIAAFLIVVGSSASRVAKKQRSDRKAIILEQEIFAICNSKFPLLVTPFNHPWFPVTVNYNWMGHFV